MRTNENSADPETLKEYADWLTQQVRKLYRITLEKVMFEPLPDFRFVLERTMRLKVKPRDQDILTWASETAAYWFSGGELPFETGIIRVPKAVTLQDVEALISHELQYRNPDTSITCSFVR